ncbi:DUF6252 family protein [Hymenobacter negativus]|uniref:Carboxypeptidase regulatory-like domain-containing protein n=1 Tax=Hymenobacter negativus TaxID=2795026 RepID=A0ABS0Q4D6_9BACT|nr:DUF6252 family protein [Hymenobacter negativus]MBH8557208.1 hypothetical protein [Hymenobacter negativus]
MNSFIRTAQLALTAAAATLLFATTSCSKKEDAAPAAPTTGSIEGTITPANSVTTVTATNVGGLTFLATPNTTSGVFTVPNLAPGAYVLSFAPRAGFQVAAARTISVVAGSTAQAGTVVVSPIPTGSITGSIYPADGATRVEATSAAGVTVSAVPDATTGAFSFPNLELGTYTVHFVVANGFLQEPDQTATLTLTALTAALGVTNIHGNGVPRGTMSWTVNGTTFTATALTGTVVASNQFVVEGTSTSGTVSDKLTIALYGSISTGTYPLGSTPYYTARYTHLVNGIVTATYTTLTNAQAGIVNIATFDRYAGATTGTFGFVGVYPTGTVTTTATISNGSFSLRF